MLSGTPFAYHARCSQTEAYLLPKLRYNFAEFLHPSSLKRLSILYLTTCVGLGYGSYNHKFRSFSWKQGINNFTPLGARLVSRHSLLKSDPDLPKSLAYSLSHGQPSPCLLSLLRPPIAIIPSTEILIRFPSTTPFGLALGVDLPYPD